eukprot:RCo048684
MPPTVEDGKRRVEGLVRRQLSDNAPSLQPAAVREICGVASQLCLHSFLLELLKESLKKDRDKELQIRTLHLLAEIVAFGDVGYAIEACNKKWMDRLIRVAGSSSKVVTQMIYQLITDWYMRFMGQPQFEEFERAFHSIRKSKDFVPDGVPVAQLVYGEDPSEDGGSLSRNFALSSVDGNQRETMSSAQRMEKFLRGTQADLAALEAGLKNPDQLPPRLVEGCRRRQHSITALLSCTEKKELRQEYTNQLIKLYDQLAENLEAHRSAVDRAVRSAPAGSLGDSASPEMLEGEDTAEYQARVAKMLRKRLEQVRAEQRQVDSEIETARNRGKSGGTVPANPPPAKKEPYSALVRRCTLGCKEVVGKYRQQLQQMREELLVIRQQAQDYCESWHAEL